MRIFSHVATTKHPTQRLPCDTGWLELPQRRRYPARGSVEIAFMRLRSTSPKPGPPTFFLEGGPGVSGLDMFRNWPEPYLAFLEFGDVVMIDQRGVGLSRPNLVSPFTVGLPLDRPLSRAEYFNEYASTATRAVTFWRQQGVDLEGFTTEESADDIDSLREALGYESIRIVGGSYGSHLALSVLRRHGKYVERAVVILVEGPDDTFKLPGNVDRSLSMIASLAAAAPELDGRVPDLRGMIAGLVARLQDQPAVVEGMTVGGFDLRLALAALTGSIDFIRKLPMALLRMEKGDFTDIAPTVRRLRTVGIESVMQMAMDCASGASSQRLAQISNEAPSCLLEDLVDFPFPRLREVLDIPTLDDEYRSPVAGDMPVLFGSGSLDGRTPPGNAVAVAQGFPNSRHVLVNGAAHERLYARPEFFEVVRPFMGGEDLAVQSVTVPFSFESPAPAVAGG